MTYSRWANSFWYTYADVAGGFTVCGVCNFSRKALMSGLEPCLEKVKGICETLEKPATTAQLNELREYMLEYLVDEQFLNWKEREVE